MNDLNKQVKRARHRLLMQQFLAIALWSLAAFLAVAGIGIAIPKIWPIGVDGNVWESSWIAGSLTVGVIVALITTYIQRKNSLNAAIEIDRRFGLKERVSSCLALDESARDSEAGRALIDDAVRRVQQVNVKEEFKISPSKWAWLPVGMAVVVFGLTFLSDATQETSGTAEASTVESRKRVNTSSEELKKKLEQQRKKAMTQGLEDAGELFKKLEKGMDGLTNREDVDRKKAMVKLNDLANDIKKRQEKLGSRDDIRKQLNQLKDLKQGPAERMAKALSNGDMKTAIDELKKLEDQMRKGELSKASQEQLQKQIEQMQNAMQQMANAHEQNKGELEEQIQKQLAEGNRKEAGELQRKLDKLKQKDEQMKKMAEMAQKMAECSSCMKEGDSQQAAAKMGEMASALQQMQQEMEEMEMLEETLDQISQAKSSMDCSGCEGSGCSMCQGGDPGMALAGMGQGQGQGEGDGLGEGSGRGDRPEDETDSNFYDSQVRSKVGKGQAVVTGTAAGPNKAGEVLEELKSEIANTKQSDDDPLTGQRLPKKQRELAREYFDAFRSGE